MRAEDFLKIINESGIEYFCGVPDSQLSAFTGAVTGKYGFDKMHHVVSVNEGCAVGLAAGYHLATGSTPCVYMQNSGLGNAVNPITSLLSKDVYAIGCLFVIGWRGQPDTHDEPQHLFMGKVTTSMLDLLDIPYLILDDSINEQTFKANFDRLSPNLKTGKSIAIVVKKDALTLDTKPSYKNEYTLNRENVIDMISELLGEKDIVVSTTGKISRELYESRKRQNKDSGKDFLTVGSMGHCSSIALSIATQKTDKRLVVLDGDGAVLMHMGSLAAVGDIKPKNYMHILLDNAAHETVGGLPTVAKSVDFCAVARASGYDKAINISSTETIEGLKEILNNQLKIGQEGATFIRIPVSLVSRKDLGRPKEKPIENKQAFMTNLGSFTAK